MCTASLLRAAASLHVRKSPVRVDEMIESCREGLACSCGDLARIMASVGNVRSDASSKSHVLRHRSAATTLVALLSRQVALPVGSHETEGYRTPPMASTWDGYVQAYDPFLFGHRITSQALSELTGPTRIPRRDSAWEADTLPAALLPLGGLPVSVGDASGSKVRVALVAPGVDVGSRILTASGYAEPGVQ